jgi:flagellar motor switch protein FliN/FliY
MSESPASSVAEEKAAAAAAARPAEFPALEASAPAGTPNPVDFILDIPLQLSVRIGSTPMLIRDLLQLGQGSVIELDKLAGEPMEVLVNGKLVARGEAVVVNEKLGVRLTDVISPMERVRHLQ